MTKTRLALFPVILICSLAGAQTALFEGPTVGIFYDQPSASIRSIAGVPGSAVFGPVMMNEILFASISPDGTLAIAQKADGLYLVRVSTRTIEPIAGTLEHVDRIAWAANASAAVLYSSASRRLQRLHINGSGLRVDEPHDVSLPDGQVTALAADVTARNVVLGLQGSQAGGIYLASASGAAVLLAAMDDPGAMVFDASGQRLFAADRSAHSILEIRNLNVGPEILLLARDHTPSALGISNDGRLLYVAAADPHTLKVFDTVTRQWTTELQLASAPTELSRVSDKSLFLLRSRIRNDEPVWIVDARRGEPLVFFVPPGEILE